MITKKEILALLQTKPQVKINLGAGDTALYTKTTAGFINVDMKDLPGIDVVWNLEEFPWPFPDGCADILMASQLVEHIAPQKFINFMDEAWRVLKVGGQFMIATPYAGSSAYWQDPTHVHGFTEVSWSYFDPFDAYSNGLLYQNYRPKPFHIKENAWYPNGNLEVLLEKRKDDKSYHPEAQWNA